MNARDGFRSAIETMQQSARLMGFLPGSGLFCDWAELDGKFEAFRLFQYPGRELGLDVAAAQLEEVVRRALKLEEFRAIWILEGVGHTKALAAGLSVTGLLCTGDAALLPERAMIPLHAGMGTAFGEKLLAALGANPSLAEVRQTVDRFRHLCRANCRAGWEDACMEPLGLVVRCLYPHLLEPVSAAMETLDPPVRGLFWHGVGRSLYFVPSNFLPIPGAGARMVRSATLETGRLEDRRNVLAGLIWAVTLVNLRRPSVIQALLSAGAELRIEPEFTNGVASALLAWHHMAPGDLRYLTPYTRPLLPGAPAARQWESWIETPAKFALDRIFAGLVLRNNIPALYTFRTSDKLTELSKPDEAPQNDG